MRREVILCFFFGCGYAVCAGTYVPDLRCWMSSIRTAGASRLPG